MTDQEPAASPPPFKVNLKECPICLHPWASHDDKGACGEKGCWCLYNPPPENVEVE